MVEPACLILHRSRSALPGPSCPASPCHSGDAQSAADDRRRTGAPMQAVMLAAGGGRRGPLAGIGRGGGGGGEGQLDEQSPNGHAPWDELARDCTELRQSIIRSIGETRAGKMQVRNSRTQKVYSFSQPPIPCFPGWSSFRPTCHVSCHQALTINASSTFRDALGPVDCMACNAFMVCASTWEIRQLCRRTPRFSFRVLHLERWPKCTNSNTCRISTRPAKHNSLETEHCYLLIILGTITCPRKTSASFLYHTYARSLCCWK